MITIIIKKINPNIDPIIAPIMELELLDLAYGEFVV
jgi:hypothetical protein